MGHSAGAHLAALVCTDDRYLKAEGLSLSILKGCVPVDTALYDIAKQIESVAPVQPARAASYRSTFGDAESQKDLSPITNVARGKDIPPFLILHVADRPDASIQSQMLAKALIEAGVSAKVVAAEGKNHGTINSDLGLSDDKTTQAMWEFLDGVLKSKKSLVEFNDKLDETFTPAKATEVFGKPNRNLGSGLIIYEYDLDDGTRVRLGFPGLAKILYAKHIKQDGAVEDIPLK